jgi:hypothetical protein
METVLLLPLIASGLGSVLYGIPKLIELLAQEVHSVLS